MHSETEEQQRFLKLFLPIRERLWRFVRATTRADRDTVDDIMSETVLRSYEGMSKLRDDNAFRSYCFTIARRVARSMATTGRGARVAPHEYVELASDHISPDLSYDLSLLMKLLAALPERTRETVILFEIADLSLEDIRNIQGGTLSGVKSRLVRGRASLAEAMNDHAEPVATRPVADKHSDTLNEYSHEQLS